VAVQMHEHRAAIRDGQGGAAQIDLQRIGVEFAQDVVAGRHERPAAPFEVVLIEAEHDPAL